MRPPQPQIESICFLFDHPSELIQALGSNCSQPEKEEILRLIEVGLPPITSIDALSTMLGYNPGFIWSVVNRTERYYRHFVIPKGKAVRKIQAPKVALKVMQKWIAYHLQKIWNPGDSVFGFCKGRSHIDAAAQHLKSRWVYSIDIENFFRSIPNIRVRRAFELLGYKTDESLNYLTKLCCYQGYLAQGAPTSPIISNIVLSDVDTTLGRLAQAHGLKYTRYADDMVFSGTMPIDRSIFSTVKSIVTDDGWKLSEKKEELLEVPKRLKVHGLLVHGDHVRLTKGYRNRIRAYKHLMREGKVKDSDKKILLGHLNYANFIDQK